MSVPDPWCQHPSERDNKTYPRILFVDTQPEFNDCIKQICVDPVPEIYQISWLPHFNMDQTLHAQKLSAKTSDVRQLETSAILDMKDMSPLNVANKIKAFLMGIDPDKAIKGAGEGWIMGSGDWFDPCVDRKGIVNTAIAYSAFGVLLLMVAADGVLQRYTGGELSCSRWMWQLSSCAAG
jgi:hypothetical protein